MRPVADRWPISLGYRQKMKSRPAYVHRGIDYAVPTGTPVSATTAGKVVHVGWGGMGRAFGIHVVIKTGAVWHIYAHLSSTGTLRKGATVTAGQRVGLSGSTGNVTGPHLHYGEFTRYLYTADRRPQFIGAPSVPMLDTSVYVQNFASKHTGWRNRVKVHAREILESDASFIVCTELYAAQRPYLTSRIKHRYHVAAVNGGRVIYYRKGRWARVGGYHNTTLGRYRKRATGAKLEHSGTGKRVNLLACHLTWQHDRHAHREAEALDLLAWGAKRFPDNRRLYAGDFNAPAVSRGRRDDVGPVMRRGGYHDVAADVSTPAAYRLDRVFGGESVEFTACRIVSHGAADAVHPGVAVRLRFPL